MPKLTVDVSGEKFDNVLVPDGWYKVSISQIPELKQGKESGKKYLELSLKIIEGNYHGTSLILRATLEKGDNPLKSKRWLFSQMMTACKIEKVNEKYSFTLEELQGKEFWVKVIVKEESYNGNVFSKNEIKQVALEPVYSDGSKGKVVEGKVVVGDSGPLPDDDDQIPF